MKCTTIKYAYWNATFVFSSQYGFAKMLALNPDNIFLKESIYILLTRIQQYFTSNVGSSKNMNKQSFWETEGLRDVLTKIIYKVINAVLEMTQNSGVSVKCETKSKINQSKQTSRNETNRNANRNRIETNATGLKKTENQLWPQKSETIFI